MDELKWNDTKEGLPMDGLYAVVVKYSRFDRVNYFVTSNIRYLSDCLTYEMHGYKIRGWAYLGEYKLTTNKQ